MYWGMVSFITPPVALATFAAAPLAGVSAMRIGVQSVRMGMALYIVPFCFVLNPALLFKGDAATVILSILAAFIGIPTAAAALQGYVFGIGRIPSSLGGLAVRGLMIAGGLLLAIPTLLFGFGASLAAGAVLIVMGLVLLMALVGGTKTGRVST
jgi:TRAP-type uncharacterized transport system fused permease subunit